MRKIVLLFGFLFCSSVHAQSNWVFITKTQNKTNFVDKNSIQRSGDSVTFWDRANFSIRDKSGDLSSKMQLTINCRTREIIIRYGIFYDDLDNNGNSTSSGFPKSSWEPIAPDTIGERLYRFVCKGG